MLHLPHEFRDPGLMELALTHASLGAEANNERLEFLGDAALDLIVAHELFLHHRDLPEGDLTELKAWVVSRRTLAAAAQSLGLDRMARVGAGLRERALPRSVLSNLYEAVLGAIYLDAGLEAAREFVSNTLRGPLNQVRQRRRGANPKQTLQHICQSTWRSLPNYVVLESRGEAHIRAFLVAAEIEGERFPDAWGRTLKEAEGWAAHEALLVLQHRNGT